jgi:hypothetical protein
MRDVDATENKFASFDQTMNIVSVSYPVHN